MHQASALSITRPYELPEGTPLAWSLCDLRMKSHYMPGSSASPLNDKLTLDNNNIREKFEGLRQSMMGKMDLAFHRSPETYNSSRQKAQFPLGGVPD